MGEMLRYNGGKAPLSYVPTAFYRAINGNRFLQGPTKLIAETARVLDFGAKKYSPNNWRKGGSWLAVVDCALRHIQYYNAGELNDPESGLSHLAHAACNLAFLLEFIDQETSTDDRFVIERWWTPDQTEGLASVTEGLMIWKDGGDHVTLRMATRELADFFEGL